MTYFLRFCGVFGRFFCWLCLGSMTQLLSAGGLAGWTEGESLTHTCSWCWLWLGHLNSWHCVPGQHSKRIKVQLQGLLRASLGNHLTLLHFTGQSKFSECPRECVLQASRGRRCNWSRVPATRLWNQSPHSRRGHRLDNKSELLVRDVGFLCQLTLAQGLPNGFAEYFLASSTQLSRPLSFTPSRLAVGLMLSELPLQNLRHTGASSNKILARLVLLAFCFSENLN